LKVYLSDLVGSLEAREGFLAGKVKSQKCVEGKNRDISVPWVNCRTPAATSKAEKP